MSETRPCASCGHQRAEHAGKFALRCERDCACVVWVPPDAMEAYQRGRETAALLVRGIHVWERTGKKGHYRCTRCHVLYQDDQPHRSPECVP